VYPSEFSQAKDATTDASEAKVLAATRNCLIAVSGATATGAALAGTSIAGIALALGASAACVSVIPVVGWIVCAVLLVVSAALSWVAGDQASRAKQRANTVNTAYDNVMTAWKAGRINVGELFRASLPPDYPKYKGAQNAGQAISALLTGGITAFNIRNATQARVEDSQDYNHGTSLAISNILAGLQGSGGDNAINPANNLYFPMNSQAEICFWDTDFSVRPFTNTYMTMGTFTNFMSMMPYIPTYQFLGFIFICWLDVCADAWKAKNPKLNPATCYVAINNDPLTPPNLQFYISQVLGSAAWVDGSKSFWNLNNAIPMSLQPAIIDHFAKLYPQRALQLMDWMVANLANTPPALLAIENQVIAPIIITDVAPLVGKSVSLDLGKQLLSDFSQIELYNPSVPSYNLTAQNPTAQVASKSAAPLLLAAGAALALYLTYKH
jgi:hypothetical protein